MLLLCVFSIFITFFCLLTIYLFYAKRELYTDRNFIVESVDDDDDPNVGKIDCFVTINTLLLKCL